MKLEYKAIHFGKYEVSNTGVVRRKESGRILKSGMALRQSLSNGYPQISLWCNGRNRAIKVHRIIARMFLGKCPVGKQVNHKNGIKTDNRITNLEYVTPKQNIKHADENGLRPKYPNRKLKDPEIFMIRKLRYEFSAEMLSHYYNVDQVTINNIWSKRTWAD